MFVDNAPILGFGELGDLLTSAKNNEATQYNQAGVNVIWRIPVLPDAVLFSHLTEYVAVFQKKNGRLTVDGKIGPRTAAALEKAVKGLKSGVDGDGDLFPDVRAALDDLDDETLDPIPGTWQYAFDNDTVPSDENYALGLRLFAGLRAVRQSKPAKPKPGPKPKPLPQPLEAGFGGNPIALIGAGVLFYLAYRSFRGQPLNPFSK